MNTALVRCTQIVLLLITAIAFSATANSQSVSHGKPAGKGWVQLIPANLAGWKYEPEYWRFEAGVFHGHTPGTKEHHYAYTTKEYADFELHADVKLVGNNSGVCIRLSPTSFDNVPGYQVDIGEGYWGALWDERGRGMVSPYPKEAAAKLVRQNDWNHYYVRAEGHHIQAWLNGVKTIDVNDEPGRLTGAIGFQLCHGEKKVTDVSFKNVYLRPLAIDPASTARSPAARALEREFGPDAWQQLTARLATVNSDIAARGIRSFPGTTDKLLTGYPYNEYYDWDLYFENVYLTYFGIDTYCFTNLKMFLDREQADGYVNRSLIKQRDRQHFKPFLAQLAVMGTSMRGDDYEWARQEYYGKLKKYLERWFAYDGDHNGLPVWNSADHSGMDNQWSRAGGLGSFEIEGVDLACYLVRELQAMAIIAGKLGQRDDQQDFLKHANRLGQLINDMFWNEKDGFYYDRNEKKNEQVKVKSVAGFMPLWAGVATPRRARRIIKEHLLNEKEFWLKYPVASYAKTEPDYYQGSHKECNWRGSTWMPTNYMIFHGLLHYGFKRVARELAQRTFRMVLEENPVTREYYNAETGGGIGQTQFWGFSALGYVMPLELQLNYDPTDLNVRVKPVVTEHLGWQFQAMK